VPEHSERLPGKQLLKNTLAQIACEEQRIGAIDTERREKA